MRPLMTTRVTRFLAAGVLFSTVVACEVPQHTTHDLNRQLALARADCERQVEELRIEVNRMRPLSAEAATLRTRVEELERELASTRQKAATAQALQEEVDRLRQTSEEADRLQVEAQQIRERAEQAMQERDSVRQELQRFIDLGAVGVEATSEGVMITMREAILFDSGKSDLKSSSSDLLSKVAEILGRSRAREIRIAGHSDNVPIRSNPEFPSNWELSTARALTVLHRLVDVHRLSPSKLVAVGFGEHRPVADNATAEGRARNRRVEIFLVPEKQD
jgi:chemotaxis protein MotB